MDVFHPEGVGCIAFKADTQRAWSEVYYFLEPSGAGWEDLLETLATPNS